MNPSQTRAGAIALLTIGALAAPVLAQNPPRGWPDMPAVAAASTPAADVAPRRRAARRAPSRVQQDVAELVRAMQSQSAVIDQMTSELAQHQQTVQTQQTRIAALEAMLAATFPFEGGEPVAPAQDVITISADVSAVTAAPVQTAARGVEAPFLMVDESTWWKRAKPVPAAEILPFKLRINW